MIAESTLLERVEPLDAQAPTQTTSATLDEGHPSVSTPSVNQQLANSMGLSTLCILCQGIFEQWARLLQDPSFNVPHYGSMSELKSSAANGCALCTQFVHSDDIDKLRDPPRESPGPQINVLPEAEETFTDSEESSHSEHSFSESEASILAGSVASSGLVGLFLPGMGNGRIENSLRLYHSLPQRSENEWPPVISMIPVAADMKHSTTRGIISDQVSNTRDSLKLCEEWLNRCQRHHKKCIGYELRFLPNRLVFVGSSTPRLATDEELKLFPRYAALSHCWGKNTFQTLSKANMLAFSECIPPEALSKTFSDAILVCKELKINYIWIDSLCIIQDDLADWQKEAPLMAGIYNGSHVTIAASGAESGSVGLFMGRSPSWRCRVQASTPNDTQLYECIPFDMYNGSVDYEPLSRRAWALQEGLLSPRVIHFTRTQVFWGCRESSVCEIFTQAQPFELRDRYTLNQVDQAPFELYWRTMVEDYTNREMALARDKLIGIAGLARQISSRTKGEYYAGLWLDESELQLCWLTRWGNKSNSTQPMALHPIAPTWSWASSNPLVQTTLTWSLDSIPTDLYITVLEVRAPPNEDPFGPISSAQLHLSCTCMWTGLVNDLGCPLDQFLHNEIYTEFVSGGRIIKNLSINITRTDNVDLSELYFLPVVSYYKHRQIRHRPDAIWVLGLILQSCKGETGQYRRIGAFNKIYKRGPLGQRFSFVRNWISDPLKIHAGDEAYSRIYRDENGETRKVIILV